MQYDLGELRSGRDHVERRYEPSAFAGTSAAADDRQPYTVIAPVELAFDAVRDERGVHLTGRVQTTLELTCGRCLEPFRFPIEAAFHLRYVPRVGNVGKGEVEVEEEDLDTAYFDDEAIDLGLLVSEQFHLALPMKPLCTEQCRGLCPQCGTDLNRATCHCEPQWTDPRWAELQQLKSRGDEGPPVRDKDD